MDAYLEVHTAKKRTHSLFRQGAYWYGAIPETRDDWLATLMKAFDEIVIGKLFRRSDVQTCSAPRPVTT